MKYNSTALLEKEIQSARKKLSEHAMAFDLLTRIARAFTEQEAIESILHKDKDLGVLEVDHVKFPQEKDRYLNLTLSMAGICGLAMENARRYQKIKDTQNKLRNEKEKLEAALAEVKKLSGLIPVCSHCKKVRDDKGGIRWRPISRNIPGIDSATASAGSVLKNTIPVIICMKRKRLMQRQEQKKTGLFIRNKEEIRLSWKDTYKSMAEESEAWDDFDITPLDGLPKESYF